jgi:hypothetical protein
LEWTIGSADFVIGTRYYAVVTAVDDEGSQSVASNEVDFVFIGPP